MKPFLFAATAAIGLFATAAVIAQDLPDRPIKRAEVSAVVKDQFARLDANHDGVVTRAEFDAYRARQAPDAGGPFGHIGGHWFEHSDQNGDGRVTLQEAEARPLQLFDMADMNHDGIVNVQERQMAEALRSLTGK